MKVGIIRKPNFAAGGIMPHEKAMMKKISEKWIDVAYRTNPIEPNKIIPAIKSLYKAANLEEPRVVIVPSPRVMAAAYGAAAAIWDSRKSKRSATLHAVAHAIRNVIWRATWRATHDATEHATRDAIDATWHAKREAISDATWRATSLATRERATKRATDCATKNATKSATRNTTWHEIMRNNRIRAMIFIEHAVRRGTGRATSDAIKRATSDAIGRATERATRDTTWRATWRATIDATRDAIERATERATRDATERATERATWRATIDATRDATRDATSDPMDVCREIAGDLGVECARNWNNVHDEGNMDAASCAYIEAARDVLKLRLPEFNKYKAWEDCAEHGGFRVMHEKFCIVSDFPKTIKVDEDNQPHCENGPSHEWRDGWKLYHWHGVPVPEHWIMEPETVDPDEILKEQNVEKRSAGISIVGMSRMLDKLHHKIVDSEVDPEHGDLIEVEIPDLPDPVLYLKARCPRNGWIMEPVNHEELEQMTVRGAQAWRVGEPVSEFEYPEIRT